MEPNKIDDGAPTETMRESWRKYPGELVMVYEHNNEYDTKSCGLEFSIRKLTAGKHFPPDNRENIHARAVFYEASMPYRACIYQGDTPEAALGALLLGVGLMGRDGHMNPEQPTVKGVPPVQHAISILAEKLVWHSERRREHLTNEPTAGLMEPDSDAAFQRISRDNDIISSLATSIAALARVKDL